MKDKEILEQREKEYGDATESFTRISKFWGEYLGVEIKPHEVAIMMTLLKVSRSKTSKGETLSDKHSDGRNYLTLAEELDKMLNKYLDKQDGFKRIMIDFMQ